MHTKKTGKICLFCTLSLLAATGCSVPVCVEGNVVCMDDKDEHMTIYQSDMCEGNRCSVSQPKSCQLYRCQGETFIPIPNGSCPLGSQMQDGTLMCIPRCHDGEMVCAVQNDDDELEIMQSSAEDEGTVNNTPCQKYKCSQNDYVSIENGYCALGSKIHDGSLVCVPKCTEGEIICGITDENDQLVVEQKDSEAEGSVNTKPCQKYKCSQNDYVAISDGYCTLGSRIQDGILSCIPRCDGLPATRCKSEQNQTIIQTCTNNGADTWQTSYCANSCQYDSASSYEEDGFKAGICGECRNDMQQYCQNTTDDQTEIVGCKNGKQSIETVDLCPANMQTKCESGYAFLNNDRNHCGSCKNACTGNDNCINGKCEPCDEEGYLDYSINGQTIRAYCIHNESELKEFHNNLANGQLYPSNNTDKAYIIVGDITYTDNWEPLGTKEKPIDKLTLIGLNHKLSFEQQIKGNQFAGVFGVVTNSLFDSVNIAKANITHKTLNKDTNDPQSDEAQAIGGFIGKMENTTIQNSVFNAEVLGTVNIGGIAGIVSDSEITYSRSAGKVTADPYKTLECENFHPQIVNMGGIAGYMTNSSFNEVHTTTALISKDDIPINRVGGLAGAAYYLNNIRNSARNADITVPGSEIGGIIGYAYSPMLSRNINIEKTILSSEVNGEIYDKITIDALYKDSLRCGKDIIIPNTDIGGLVGKFDFEDNGQLSLMANSVYGKIIGEELVGGYIGTISSETNGSEIGFVNIDGCMFFDAKDCIEISHNDIEILGMKQIGGIIGATSTNTTSININNVQGKVDIKSVRSDSDRYKIGGIIGKIYASLNMTNLIMDVNISMGLDNFITDITITDLLDDLSTEDYNTTSSSNISLTNHEFISNEADKFYTHTYNVAEIGGIAGDFISHSNSIKNMQLSFNITGDQKIGGLFGTISYTEPHLKNINITRGSIQCINDCGGIFGDFIADIDSINNAYESSRYSELSFFEYDISLKNITINGKFRVGGIIGHLYHNDAYYPEPYYHLHPLAKSQCDKIEVSGNLLVGGLIGYVENGILAYHPHYNYNVHDTYDYDFNVIFDHFDVHGNIATGNIIGGGSFKAIDCKLSQHDISHSTSYIYGSLVGVGNVDLSECSISNMIIQGKSFVGSLLGCGEVHLSGCHLNNINTQGESNVGGLIGIGGVSLTYSSLNHINVKGDTYIGGLNNSDDISIYISTLNNINVNGKTAVGGLSGISKNISFASSILNGIRVHGDTTVGGLAGIPYSSYDKDNIYETNFSLSSYDSLLNLAIEGSIYVGGVLGATDPNDNASYIEDIYFQLDDSGLLINISSLEQSANIIGGLIGNVSPTEGSFYLAGTNTYQYVTFNNNKASNIGNFIGNYQITDKTETYIVFSKYYNFPTSSIPAIGKGIDLTFTNETPIPFTIKNKQFRSNNKSVSKALNMSECMMKILTSADGSTQCLKVPYPNFENGLYDLETSTLTSICIPEDQIEKECGSNE